MTVLAVVATYEPDELVVETSRRLIEGGTSVLIVDDFSQNASAIRVLDLCESLGAQVVRKRENLGIGDSLNVGLRVAIERSDEFLLTLDQDTVLPAGYVSACIQFIRRATTSGVNVGLVTAERLNGRLRTPRSQVGRSGFYSAVDPMQSGSLLRVSLAQDVGGFRADFVMDCIDVDFCLKLRAVGAKILWVEGENISHELGRISEARLFGRAIRIGNRHIHVSNHSSSRRYYMTRNRIVLLKEYFRRDKEWFTKSLRAYTVETLAAVAFEARRMHTLRAVIVGARDGFGSRLGKRR